jgi:hypothetical protein
MSIRNPVVRLAAAIAFAALIITGACNQKPAADHGPPPPSGPLQGAFTVAFGKPAPYATLDDDGDHVVYSPQALIELDSGVVALISKEEIPGGCKACAGSLTIAYLRRGPSGFERIRSWPEVGGKGRYGAALPWTIRTDLDDGPTLVTRDDHKEGDCRMTMEELITLRPAGPVKIATLVTAMAYDPKPGEKTAPRLTSTIVPQALGKRFTAVFSGTDSFRQVFNRQGDIFTSYGPAATGC